MITLPFSSVHERRLPGPDGELVTVREGRIKWERSANPVRLGSQTYDVKPQVEVDGRRLVPELALLRFAEQGGWQGAWMDNFHWKCWRAMPNRNEPWIVPERFAALLGDIVEPELRMGRVRWPGCWDLFVWRGEAVAFIESKGGEGLEDSQLRFFASALGAGIPPTAFTLVEWELRPAAKQATAHGSSPTHSPETAAQSKTPWRARAPRQEVPGNISLPPLPAEVVALVGNLSPAQVFMIMNPQMISERRPSRVRKGLVVRGKEAMTPSDGMAGRSRRTEHGDAIAAAIAPLLPSEYLPTADLPDLDRA